MNEKSDLICGKAAVGGNNNSTRDREDAVKVDGGVWRSLDGTRQFRVVESDYFGRHGIGSPLVPNTPHVHFEFLGMPNAGGNKLKVIKNVHVPLK